MPPSVFQRPPPELAAFAFDAAAAVALAAFGVNWNGQVPCARVELHRALRASSFSGASGEHYFVNGSGDRAVSGIDIVVIPSETRTRTLHV